MKQQMTSEELWAKVNAILPILKGLPIDEALSTLTVVQAISEAQCLPRDKVAKVHEAYCEKVTEFYEIYKEEFDNENRREA